MKRTPSELTRPLLRYVTGVTLAHIMAATEVLLVMAALSRETHGAVGAIFTGRSAVVVYTVDVAAVMAVAAGSAFIALPSLRWYTSGRPPTSAEREAALRIPRRQTAMLLGVWILSAVPILLTNRHAAGPISLTIAPPLLFGATAAILTALLLTVRTLRPLTTAAMSADATATAVPDTAPGVMARLLSMWVLTSALPSLGVALLILARRYGWIIDESTSVELPVLLLLAVSVLWGVRAMILVSQSISDPVRDVVEAMSDVEHGNLEHTVAVYERSEIGRLQSGFNRMVFGLRERERLRDLFGRHVGDEVVRLLVDRDASVHGGVRNVAILFIDLADSTQLAANSPPQEVADVLNRFFQTVVAVVDEHRGFVNKFQGDAALALFGAPVLSDTAEADALATARELAERMRAQPEVDFGIGVSAGAVFAGFVGAHNRFEYTVIGDPVNEAARLADQAKSFAGRVLCSGDVLSRTDSDEQLKWQPEGSVTLRGRSSPTQLSAPRS